MEKKWSHLFENRKEAENSIRWKNGEKKTSGEPRLSRGASSLLATNKYSVIYDSVRNQIVDR